MGRIDFLGTGNAFTPFGRLHALALIDQTIMIDTPPSLIPQLRKYGISTSKISHLLFTHWHADHTFGFPFFLLERKYISDTKNEQELNIYLRPGGKEFLTNLCNMGFPGSLENDIDKIANWNEIEETKLAGTDWEFERFPVCHTPETDPHGYELKHKSKFTVLHCGDSGPCEEIEKRTENANVIILEMGMPDIGDFPYHYTPKDVKDFSQRNPDKMILVTHNYASSKNNLEGFPIPDLPENTHQLEDGDAITFDENGSVRLLKNSERK
ncbi:MBL fold metallo-hydrolase [Euryarchaeota archaeon]|nr:MBL fold metallo-hydrolase [Euryarchaeota archaeon]